MNIPHNHDKAKEFAINKLLRELYYDQIKSELDGVDYSKEYDPSSSLDEKTFNLMKTKIENKQIKQTKLQSTHVFITVNPSEDNLPLLHSKVQKCLTKEWLQGFTYCYEQRSNDSEHNFYGYHLHLLIPRSGKSPSDIIREFTSTFKNICGTQKAINFQWCTNVHARRAYDYMLGTKCSQDKMQKVERDRLWRKQENLQDFYSGGTLFSDTDA